MILNVLRMTTAAPDESRVLSPMGDDTLQELFKNKSVLVADNSNVMTRLIKNFLGKAGFNEKNIYQKHDGDQALELLEADAKRIDLVISGLHMKSKNGIELLRSIRKSAVEKVSPLPFLLITAERNKDILKELEQAGGNGYLSKPFKTEELTLVLKDIFENKPGEIRKAGPATATSGHFKYEQNHGQEMPPQIITPFAESAQEALGQYMVKADVGDPIKSDQLRGDFSAAIDLSDPTHQVKIVIILVFPKSPACKIYENLFGEVDMDQVCGIVQELVNIIGGAIKPKISDYGRDILQLVYPEKDWDSSHPHQLKFDLGFPTAKMGENHSVDLQDHNDPRFVLPLNMNGDQLKLVTLFQKVI